MRRGIVPVTWNIKEFHELNYKDDLLQYTQPELAEEYISAGHQPNAIGVSNYFEPNPMPNGVEDVRQYFNDQQFTNVDIAVNLFKPGMYLPYHRDLYGNYKKRNHVNSSQSVVRIIVMLENHSPGQMIHIKDRVYSDWDAGMWFSWEEQEKHTFYNLSTVPRYALQVTATRSL